MHLKGVSLVARYLIAIAAIIVVQLVPITGAFLMMFLGILWPAALFNIMLVHVGFRAATGKIERPWLALSLAVYVVWAAIGGIAYVQALNLQATMSAANDAMPRLSSADRVFTIRSQDSRIENEASLAFANVLQNARVYSRDRRYERASDTRCRRTEGSEWRIEGEAPRVDRSFTLPAIRFDGACLVSRTESSPSDGLLVELRPFSHHAMFIRLESGKALTLSRRTAAGTQVLGEIRQGRIEHVRPFPLFLAGCSLLSAGPSWQCVWQVERGVLSVGQYNSFGRHYQNMDQALFVAERLGAAHN